MESPSNNPVIDLSLARARKEARTWIEMKNSIGTLEHIANSHGQILANVMHTRWFETVVAEYILSQNKTKSKTPRAKR